MARKSAKRGRQPPPAMQHYFLQIDRWQPSYGYGVENAKWRRGPYREHMGLELRTSCFFPEKLAGKEVELHLVGERDALEPEVYKRDLDWKSAGVGALEMYPDYGRFYAVLPHDGMTFVLVGLTQGLFKLVGLYGPVLRWRKSLCMSIDFRREVDLTEY